MNFQPTWQLRLPLSLFAAAYLWGVLSIQHYLPSGGLGLYINLHVAVLAALGTVLGLWLQGPAAVHKVSVATVLWLLLFLLLALQPVTNRITYPDSLIFPAGAVLLAGIVTWLAANLSAVQKQQAVRFWAWVLAVAGALLVMTQAAQLWWPDNPLIGILLFPRSDSRLIGNIAQVNQAAFVAALGMAATIYLAWQNTKKWQWLLFALLLAWLAIGIGFSASRGGIILGLAAVFCASIFHPVSFKQRLTVFAACLLVVVTAYILGSFLLKISIANSITGAERAVSEQSLHLRWHMLIQAWQAFSQNWFTGIGWGEYNGFGLRHAESLPWFTQAHHSHNIVAQIGAELGLPGLLVLGGFFIVLLRNFKWNLQPYQTLAYSVLVLCILYSLSEFPLWYFRFLLLPAFFLGIIEKPKWQPKLQWRYGLIVLSCILCTGSLFYLVQYRKYSDAAYVLQSDHQDESAKIAAYRELPHTFGYSSYRELMLFMVWPVGTDQLDEHIRIGNRVIADNPSPYLIVKQANLLVLAGRSEEADKLYRAACLHNYQSDCAKVAEFLGAAASENPSLYQSYWARFNTWQQALPRH